MSTVILHGPESLFDFFRAEVEAACFEEGVGLTEQAGLYLVQLLAERARAEADPAPDATLAELHLQAAQARPAEQARTYRAIGDRALHDLGYFRERLTRGIVSPSYYRDMGAAAYQRVDRVTKTWFAGAFGDLFEELSDRFGACVSVVARVRDAQSPEQDVDRLWAEWVSTGSEDAARRLRLRGLVLPRSREEA